jgi:membrane protease YdiL (CAAX protease family)
VKLFFAALLAGYVIHVVLINRVREENMPDLRERGPQAPLMPFILFCLALLFDTEWARRLMETRRPLLLAVAVAAAAAAAAYPLFRRQAGGAVMHLLQLALFLSGAWLAWRMGAVDQRLFSPAALFSGIIAGLIIFGISLSIMNGAWLAAIEFLGEFRALWRYTADHPRALFGCIDVSLAEEVIYRAAAQNLLLAATGSPALAIAAAAVVFSVVHWHFFRNPLLHAMEFTAFALTLGLLYFWTGSLLLVTVVHVIRNLGIIYLESIEMADETDAPMETPEPARTFLRIRN